MRADESRWFMLWTCGSSCCHINKFARLKAEASVRFWVWQGTHLQGLFHCCFLGKTNICLLETNTCSSSPSLKPEQTLCVTFTIIEWQNEKYEICEKIQHILIITYYYHLALMYWQHSHPSHVCGFIIPYNPIQKKTMSIYPPILPINPVHPYTLHSYKQFANLTMDYFEGTSTGNHLCLPLLKNGFCLNMFPSSNSQNLCSKFVHNLTLK